MPRRLFVPMGPAFPWAECPLTGSVTNMPEPISRHRRRRRALERRDVRHVGLCSARGLIVLVPWEGDGTVDPGTAEFARRTKS